MTDTLNWRSHIWVTGDTSTGKTTLASLYKTLFGSSILFGSAPTEAGVRQSLSGAARPVMIDEIEPDPTNNRSREVVGLARLASSDSQGDVLRGSAEGKAQTFPIRACFYFSSILHPSWLPQDAGRICVLDLDELQVTENDITAVDDGIASFGAMGPALRRRMVDGWPRCRQNILAFRTALTRNQRSTRHQADQFGTLLACAYTLLSDTALTNAEASEILASLNLRPVADRDAESSAELCLNHLMSFTTGFHEGSRMLTLGEVVYNAATLSDGGTSRQALEAYGLMLVHATSDGGIAKWTGGLPSEALLAVANRHQSLERVFMGTRWAGGA